MLHRTCGYLQGIVFGNLGFNLHTRGRLICAFSMPANLILPEDNNAKMANVISQSENSDWSVGTNSNFFLQEHGPHFKQ
jgi:hypothetical protein